MGMDYNLKKAYEQILEGKTSEDKSPKTLKEAYKQIKNLDFVEEAIVDMHNPEVTYNKVIARVLSNGDVTKIPEPKGNYILGSSFKFSNAEDSKIFKQLYPVTPPKSGATAEEDLIGTKGSGNGEIALYWLLSKGYFIRDGRGSAQPDLYITNNDQTEKEVGVEIKAYDSNKLGLGRFGNQTENRRLLSIVFGLQALLVAFGETKNRPPSLDTFNKDELITSFEALRGFYLAEDIKQLATRYEPLRAIYDQIRFVVSSLKLSDDFTAEQGAAELMKKFLFTKLDKKPGFGGFIANVSTNGVVYHHVNKERLDSLEPKIILDNVNANGAALLINPQALFGSSSSSK